MASDDEDELAALRAQRNARLGIQAVSAPHFRCCGSPAECASVPIMPLNNSSEAMSVYLQAPRQQQQQPAADDDSRFFKSDPAHSSRCTQNQVVASHHHKLHHR